MKKIALILASLLAVSTVVSAKEIIVRPEAVAEPEVIVVAYESKWKPSGYVDLGYRYYGHDEYDSADFGRVQMQGKFNFTEKDRVEYRFRRYNSYQTMDHQSSLDDDQKIGSFGDASQARLRYFYNNGLIGDSKINLTQRLQYENAQSLGAITSNFDNDGNPLGTLGNKYQDIEYRVIFEFAQYMDWTPEWFKNTSATIQPYFYYEWDDSDSSNIKAYGAQLGSMFTLPAGFSFEFNLYPEFSDYNQKSAEWKLAYEAYLYYGYNLYAEGPYALDFNFEGGMDPYVFNSDSSFGKVFSESGDASYEAYALPSLEISYRRTEHMKIYAGIAGEYRNWRESDKTSARKWSWMPQAYAGLRLDF
ncbi:MAG: FomA family porin-like outer membrane protein [Fusobacteriaceae bacterium]